MHKSIYSIAIFFFLLTAILSGTKIYGYFQEASEQAALYDGLAQMVEQAEAPTEPRSTAGESAPTAPPEEPEPEMLAEYAALYEQNSDLVGWICIADTRINYPVVQSPEEPDFYLDHSFDGSKSDYGCPYVSEICDVSGPSDNLIIYGHHKKNGTMFSDLKKYRKQSFWEEHKTFRFDTLYERQTYEVVAVFKTVVYTKSADEFRYYQFADAKTPEQFDAYIARCKELALYDTGVTAVYGDELVTLSTCEYSSKNGRLVVVAKKVEG